ncbi:MAG: TIGR01212 family radical SAM protein [Candidatus Weimeria sp.]
MKIVTLSDHLKDIYGQKIYKLSLSAGCTCPNRDGTLGTGGCTFCSAGGSGEFAENIFSEKDTDIQIENAKRRIAAKLPADISPEDRKYIAYFQSYTNTYGDTERLRSLYEKVIRRDDIAVLSIGTRPDCIDDEKLRMLSDLNRIKPVWVELGLQTAHDRTAERIHRGYRTDVFRECFYRLKKSGLEVVVHIILGLPGETREDMLDTVRFLSDLTPGIDGIKIQMLNILRGSQLAEEYQKHPYPLMSMEEYTNLVVDCLKILPENIVIHRMTGDGPRSLLIAPLWVTDKKRVMNMLHKKIGNAIRDL